MKPVVLSLLLLLSAAPVAFAQTAPAPKPEAAQTKPETTGLTMYRDFIFGVSKADIRKYEKAAFYKEEGDSVYFLYEPDYFRRQIRYDFRDNKLIAIKHEILELRLPNPYRILEMSQDEQKFLSELYGEPAKQEFFWKNKEYEKIPEAWGRALYSRDLQIQITWNLPDSDVVLQTYYDGGNYQIHYTIVHRGSEIKTAPTNAIDLGVAPQIPAKPQP